MQLKNYNTFFFFCILLLVTVVTFIIFKPFMVAILLAAVLATLFSPLYDFFLRITRNRNGFSAFFTSLMLLLIIVAPLTIIIVLVGNELMNAYRSFAASGDFYQSSVEPVVRRFQAGDSLLSQFVQHFFSRESFAQYSNQISQLFLEIVQKTYQSVSQVLFLMFVMFFSIYYFLKDGKDIVKKIMYISPLKDSHEKILVQKFVSMSRAMIKGTLVVSLIQGVIGGLTFAIVGIHSAVIWAVAMAVLSLIPLFGSGIVWFPVAMIMLLFGHIWQAMVILAVGFGIISTIDNILKPRLVGRDAQMHPLLVLFATLGGIAWVGFLGFIIGPIIVALFVTLWDIYGVEFKGQLEKYNA